MSGYNVDALIASFVTDEDRDRLVEGLSEPGDPLDPRFEADLIVENWLPPILDRVKREAAAEALEEAAKVVHVARFMSEEAAFSGPGNWFHAHIRIVNQLRDRATSIREGA